ncbi:MAG: HAMP domain-containing sensor histidine kinase [Peptococcaceae bacterium]|nr:HAMP domain-containing sensor histidine kinase [Peptococcaceae bacterium]
MLGVCACLIIIIMGLLCYVWGMKRELHRLAGQLELLVAGENEKMLDLALIDKDLEHLAGLFNRLNDRQRQAVADARHHEETLKENVANISHDLRTPLTVILGHLQLLAREPLSDKATERVAIIRSKAETMKTLTERFYTLSLLEDDDTPPKRSCLNLTNLLLNLLAEQAPAFEKRGLVPQIELPQSSVFIESDSELLERIFQNLFTNALHYAAGNVRITLQQTTKGVVFTMSNPVADSASLDPNRLFDRFYTADPARSTGTSGLGLAIVKILVERLGGSVRAELEGNELRFTLCLK